MELDSQAVSLNDAIKALNPAVLDMLSAKGKAIFFPKLGILAQSAEANGKDINATIGIALEDDGSPVALPSIVKNLNLPGNDAYTYAPSPGRADLRKLWKEMLGKKNPGLAGRIFSNPVVTSALTHGLSMAGYLFCDPGDTVILPDLFWENYGLIFTHAYGAALDTFPTYTGEGKAGSGKGRFNIAGLKAKLDAPSKGGKKIVLLNFPNNPSGYTPYPEEVQAIAAAVKAAAERGEKVVMLIDDAYFGLVFEDGVYKQSIFCDLCDLHPNVLAVKIDGATKEDYVWGFRVGFLTYGIKGGTPALYEALEAKTGGAIRGNISNSSNPAQSLLLRSWSSAEYSAEKKQKFDLLKKRYDEVKRILAAHPEYQEQFTALPFNSGYFMCIRPKADSEKLRQKLLKDYSTGTINFGGILRLAFSATPTGKLEKLFENVFKASKELTA
ncbi:MAG: aminotransferase class I/II-fold pyridoxal phosphate-dependent enzyme [Fibrobacteres bacterium]|jgi:aspartate/methionine/tyrosine aminotransferase|nr:aminotransferase class I/II-fold pyridoxal phosphate-dependent enzyme [Fibrobacterota bacterium]